MQLHDFKDGAGEVPAHRHPNGGGWVADSATVEATAYVGPRAQVYGRAKLYGYAGLFGHAKVCGDAVVNWGHFDGRTVIDWCA